MFSHNEAAGFNVAKKEDKDYGYLKNQINDHTSKNQIDDLSEQLRTSNRRLAANILETNRRSLSTASDAENMIDEKVKRSHPPEDLLEYASKVRQNPEYSKQMILKKSDPDGRQLAYWKDDKLVLYSRDWCWYGRIVGKYKLYPDYGEEGKMVLVEDDKWSCTKCPDGVMKTLGYSYGDISI